MNNLVEFFKTCTYPEFVKWINFNNIANYDHHDKYKVIIIVSDSIDDSYETYIDGICVKSNTGTVYNVIGANSPYNLDNTYTLKSYYKMFKVLCNNNRGLQKIFNTENVSVIVMNNYEDCIRLNKDNDEVINFFKRLGLQKYTKIIEESKNDGRNF